MQYFPPVICDDPDLNDMGKQELSDRVERLTGRVTALEHASRAEDHAPSGIRATFYMALVSLIATVVGVPIMFLSWIEPHLKDDLKNDIKIEVTEQLKDQLKEMHGMAVDIAEIKGKLEVLDPLIQKLTAQRLTETEKLDSKELLARLPELKNLAKTAKRESVTIKPEVVEKVGKQLVDAGTAEAWNAALDFLDYKSFLNVSLSLAVNNVMGTGVLNTRYVATTPAGMDHPAFSIAGAVTKE